MIYHILDKFKTHLRAQYSHVEQLPSYKRWLLIASFFIVILAFYIMFGLHIQPVNINGKEQSQTLYLLSAIAQSLAAIVALTFTISLVLAQISSRYSLHILKGFFDKYTNGYVLLFVVTILLSFWQLAETNSFIVKICLIFSSACIIFLLPFFLYIREKLDPEYQLGVLSTKSLQRLTKNKTEIPTEINTIENVVYSSYSNNDYETFDKAVQSICEIVYEFQIHVIGEGKEPQNNTARDILTKLNDISIRFITDIRAPYIVITQLCELSKKCNINNSKTLPTLSIDFLTNYIGIKAAEENLNDLIRLISSCLSEIGSDAIENKRGYTALKVYTSYEEFVEKLIDLDKPSMVSTVLSSISTLGKKAAQGKDKTIADFYSEFIDTKYHYVHINSLPDAYARLFISQCELAIIALNMELWDVAENSIARITDNHVETLTQKSRAHVKELGVDIIFIGAMAQIKNKPDYIEMAKGRVRKLESKIERKEMINIFKNSVIMAERYEKRANTIEGLKVAVKSFLMEYDIDIFNESFPPDKSQ